MMPGTITVKGIGRVLAKPDYVVITMDLAKVERASDRELVDMALKAGFNLKKYEIK